MLRDEQLYYVLNSEWHSTYRAVPWMGDVVNNQMPLQLVHITECLFANSTHKIGKLKQVKFSISALKEQIVRFLQLFQSRFNPVRKQLLNKTQQYGSHGVCAVRLAGIELSTRFNFITAAENLI